MQKRMEPRSRLLSPVDATVLSGEVPLKELQARGFKVVPWTTNDPEKMRTEVRMGIDGLITDRPDLLQKVLKEERAAAKTERGARAACQLRCDGAPRWPWSST